MFNKKLPQQKISYAFSAQPHNALHGNESTNNALLSNNVSTSSPSTNHVYLSGYSTHNRLDHDEILVDDDIVTSVWLCDVISIWLWRNILVCDVNEDFGQFNSVKTLWTDNLILDYVAFLWVLGSFCWRQQSFCLNVIFYFIMTPLMLPLIF